MNLLACFSRRHRKASSRRRISCVLPPFQVGCIASLQLSDAVYLEDRASQQRYRIYSKTHMEDRRKHCVEQIMMDDNDKFQYLFQKLKQYQEVLFKCIFKMSEFRSQTLIAEVNVLRKGDRRRQRLVVLDR